MPPSLEISATKVQMELKFHLNQVFFTNDEKVSQYVEVERQGAEFTIGEEEYLTPSEDVIGIERY